MDKTRPTSDRDKDSTIAYDARQELMQLIQRAEREKEELNQQLKLREAEIQRLSQQRGQAAVTAGFPQPNFSTPSSGVNPPGLLNSMSPVDGASIAQMLELTRLQYQAHTDSMRLPPADLVKFDGEPLKYWEFMRLFTTIVDKGTVTDEDKLTRLHQYTTGKARDAISHCLYNTDPSIGFKAAMSILKTRFGSPYTISQAWVEKVLTFKDITDNQQLQTFADTLRSCHDTLRAMDCADELNGGRALRSIVDKLPNDLKKRWLTLNFEITESGRMPKLLDVVKLVEIEAAKRADPIFGNLVGNMPVNSKSSSNKSTSNKPTNNNAKKKKQSFVAESTETKPKSVAGSAGQQRTPVSASPAKPKPKAAPIQKCPECGEDHFLNQCSGFRALSVQERLTFVRQNKLCQNCFAKGHIANECTRNWVCRVPGCNQKHNSWLHSAIVTSTSTSINDNHADQSTAVSGTISQVPGSGTSDDSTSTSVQAHATRVKQSKIALPILPVIVSDPDGQFTVNTYALLDSGSNGSFCSDTLSHALKLESSEIKLSLNTLDSSTVNLHTKQVSLRVQDARRERQYLMKGVLTRNQLNITLDSLVTPEEVAKWPHLRDIAEEIPDIDFKIASEVHLLIGLDQPDILAPRELRCGESGDPYATLSGLGWTLNGPIAGGPPGSYAANCAQLESTDCMAKMESLVERFWKLDDPVSCIDQSTSATDKEVLQLWDQETKREDGHYVLPIPFKVTPPKLENNYAMAKHRLDLLGRRLKKDPDLRKAYTAGIQDSLIKGYAEEVTDADTDGSVWYLPHHPVLNPKKPGKVRIVFDCAASYQGTTLNDQVHQGPDLANKLLGVLLKFRQEPIALNADIEEMFCQVRVPAQQRDVLRFLWWEDGDPTKPPKQYRMTTHLFGGVWCPSAATFALRQVATDYRDEFSDEAADTVLNSFYVDDCLKSVATEEEAIKLAAELRQLLAQGGFALKKWLSNSKQVMKSIPAEDWAKSLRGLNLDRDDLPYDRTLGVLWDVDRDCFTFDARVPERPVTKRGILSMTSSIYDPLGFAAPFVLRAKALFQELCRLNLGWDDEIPEHLTAAWRRWLADLPQLSELYIPRCLKPPDGDLSTEVRLHHFCDASEMGYGAVSYIKINNKTSLVMAKSKLAPIKPTSIPRLELLGAVLATELDLLIKRHLEIQIDETYYWTDSTIVLQYINSSGRRFQTFVANRVVKITERSRPNQWRHVDSESNPADDLSRGLTAREMLVSDRWLTGPAFLQLEEEEWPIQPNLGSLPEDAEVKKPKEVYATDVSGTDGQAATDAIDRLLLRYSDWHRLKRAVVIVLRLKALLRKRAGRRLTDPITVDELQEAEIAIVNHLQTEAFGSTLTRTSHMASLKPFKDNSAGSSILRVGGRLTNAPIAYEAKHPAILPGDHHVVGLIVRHYHCRLGHAGQERVLAEARQRFWILKGRAVVSKILKSCLKCRRQKSFPQPQQMADLPQSRVQPDEPAFTRVGVDYFGPFYVKRGRSEVKRYGCLFTCLTTRAIHLEVSHSLDTNSFINALQRFIARRGPPAEIRSDNGTNFVGAQRELRQAIEQWNQSQIHDRLLQTGVRWIFNPPAASHMGGVWERQIRTVRSILQSITTQQQMDDECLETLFCSVEAIVNGRPITKLSSDPEDSLPLTPNHLLLLRAGPTLPPGTFDSKDVYRRRWRQVQHLADLFWARWLKEYLPALQERQKWHNPTRNLQPGDLVLMLQEHTHRNLWPLGLVTATYPGADGLVRTVQIKTQGGQFTRPVDKLCLLEANLV